MVIHVTQLTDDSFMFELCISHQCDIANADDSVKPLCHHVSLTGCVFEFFGVKRNNLSPFPQITQNINGLSIAFYNHYHKSQLVTLQGLCEVQLEAMMLRDIDDLPLIS